MLVTEHEALLVNMELSTGEHSSLRAGHAFCTKAEKKMGELHRSLHLGGDTSVSSHLPIPTDVNRRFNTKIYQKI